MTLGTLTRSTFAPASSSALAAAYGIAVSMTMVLTTVLFAVVAFRSWHWNVRRLTLFLVLIFPIDLAFFAAVVTLGR